MTLLSANPLTTACRHAILYAGGDDMVLLYALFLPALILIWIAKDS